MKTVWGASGAGVVRTGPAAAVASRATTSSWRMSSVDGRSRCHGAAAETGRLISRHRNVELTSTGGRRGRSMWRITIGRANRPSNSPAGLANLI